MSKKTAEGENSDPYEEYLEYQKENLRKIYCVKNRKLTDPYWCGLFFIIFSVWIGSCGYTIGKKFYPKLIERSSNDISINSNVEYWSPNKHWFVDMLLIDSSHIKKHYENNGVIVFWANFLFCTILFVHRTKAIFRQPEYCIPSLMTIANIIAISSIYRYLSYAAHKDTVLQQLHEKFQAWIGPEIIIIITFLIVYKDLWVVFGYIILALCIDVYILAFTNWRYILVIFLVLILKAAAITDLNLSLFVISFGCHLIMKVMIPCGFFTVNFDDNLKEEFRRVHRLYYSSRYFILFGFCILLKMFLLLKLTLWIVQDLDGNNFLYYTIWGGSCYIILFIYHFGQMVISTAAAIQFHAEFYGGSSMKALLHAIFITTKYHLGSLCLYSTIILPIFRVLTTTEKSGRLEKRQILQYYTFRYSSTMTAMYGLDHYETTKKIFSFMEKSALTFLEAYSYIWGSIFAILFSSNSLLLILMWANGADDPNFSSLTWISYFTIMALYIPIIKVLDTVTDTITFCEFEKENAYKRSYYSAD